MQANTGRKDKAFIIAPCVWLELFLNPVVIYSLH